MMMPYSYPSSPTTTTTSNNLFEWMQTECPGEILPRILAFTGPQMAQTLSRTNRFWKKVLDDDATWRVLCEELYKVRRKRKITGVVCVCVVPFPKISHDASSLCAAVYLFRIVCCSGNKETRHQSRGESFTSTIHVSQSTIRPSMRHWVWSMWPAMTPSHNPRLFVCCCDPVNTFCEKPLPFKRTTTIRMTMAL